MTSKTLITLAIASIVFSLLIVTDFRGRKISVESNFSSIEIERVTDPYERAILYHSQACQEFYKPINSSDALAGPMLVWESHGSARNFATDSVVCPDGPIPFVYVDNVKAGSTAMREVLRKKFNCSWERHKNWAEAKYEATCKEKTKPKVCRSKTNWLTEEIVNDFFFFSMVREPISRFVSGYKQALFQDPELRDLTISQYVDKYRNYNLNEHTQTQAMRLSGSDENGNQVPMHFIGALETIDADMSLLWKKFNLPAEKMPHSYVSETSPLKASLNTTLSDEDIVKLCGHLKQDFVCFGYPFPPQCQ
mmetsp:Transcript_6478/g.9744  ORF Transcript_6478/g.9744 Transcript_6478/m.9744 type:complete len:307 (-) Transcript_6478:107-1027(-)